MLSLRCRSLVADRALRLSSLVAALGLVASACGGDSSACTIDTDCATDQRCDRGFCVAKNATTPQPDIPQDMRTQADVRQQTDRGPVPDVTVDRDEPTVADTTPVDGADNVPVPFTVTITFSEPMKTGSVGKTSFVVEDINGEQVDGTYAWNADNTEVTYTPTAPVLHGSPYRVLLMTTIRDVAGNNLVARDPFVFYTQAAADGADLAAMASRYAPTFRQGLDPQNPQHDLPVAIDLDGDWDTTDNMAYLQSPETKKLSPAVYWAGSATRSHVFLTYMLYWPLRDQRAGAENNVPNDTAGVLVVVRRARPDQNIAEEPVLVETTFAQGSSTAEFLAYAPVDSTFNDIEQRVPNNDWFVDADSGQRFEFAVTANKHEVCLFGHGGTLVCQHDANGFVGTKLVPQVVADEVGRQGGKFVFPDEVGYELIPLASSVWPRRLVTADSTLWQGTFTYGTGLPPERPGNGTELPDEFNRALAVAQYSGRPPWAWKWKSGTGKGEARGLPRGLSFLDAAWFVSWRHIHSMNEGQVTDSFDSNTGDGWSLSYCTNPWFFIEQSSTDPQCP